MNFIVDIFVLIYQKKKQECALASGTVGRKMSTRVTGSLIATSVVRTFPYLSYGWLDRLEGETATARRLP